ncbi:MAG: exodeoxyribonuclease VII small subunit [Bacteroides sp.]|nr:exodeoxyribonuclease VII small subunit [Bacteroides sp.]
MKSRKINTYRQAIERLESIVRLIDSNELDIDRLGETIKEANELIALCSSKLTQAEKATEKIKEEKDGSEE